MAAMNDFTIKNLREVEDLAVKHGFSDVQEARFPRQDLGAEATGLAYIVVRPGKRQAFGHRHQEAEEVCVVLSGSGRVRLDDEVIEIGPMDAIRIAPNVTRKFEAGPEGLELLVFGPHHDRDSEMVQDFWAD
jgi:mannose-6-phosphate isomerase-like protein (cupin superfamily)